MEAKDILNANPDELIEEESVACSMTADDATRELKRQKQFTKTSKKLLCESVNNAVNELTMIVNELTSQAKLGNDTSAINSLLFNSLILLIDELDFIAGYIERIENSIDMACFDVAKKLNESIVNLIGHRKDILFRVIETSYKIHDYIIKWKRIANDTLKMDLDDDTEQDYMEQHQVS